MKPVTTDGFAFVEFVDSTPAPLCSLFLRMGFHEIGADRAENVVVMNQGPVTFFVNSQPNTFYDRHGPSVRGFGLRVSDPLVCARRALSAGASPFDRESDGDSVIDTPTVRGIGDSLLYLVPASPTHLATNTWPGGTSGKDCGITGLDHTSHIVRRESLDRWVRFYAEALDFSQGQYLDVRGRTTGMQARSMVGECGKARIPIAASAHDDPGALNQNDEFIRDYKGEGIQHIALATDNIFHTVDALREAGIEFMEQPPAAYYDDLERRIPGHGYPQEGLRRRGILLDGTSGQDMLLQIFTRRQIGPVFFEIIQRINHLGFGEGNFRELFEAQEKDQLRRQAEHR
jgi:4-hydroxyphenylpyruvate dioxygenase